MQTRLSDADCLDALQRATDRVSELAATSEPALRVPTCPDWTVRDLLEHLGGVHTWARRVVAGGSPKEPKPPLEGDPVRWYADQASEMMTAMRAADPTQQAWTFRSDERTAAFWFRRQLHETEMHLLDIALARGEGEAYPPQTADDGITETFDVMLPRMNRDAPLPVSAPIALVAADTGTGWVIRPSEQPGVVNYTITSAADASADAAVCASASAAALLGGLWRRSPYTQWSIDGEHAVLDELMSSELTP